MIISASRRTDIPAFFSDWFMERVKQGYFYQMNPFNPKQIKGYSLAPDDVDAIGFFTKNPGPFLKHLSYLDSHGYPYFFHVTLNNYPQVFEPNLPSVEERIAVFQELSNRIGSAKVIWRYDPIIISSLTPMDYHLEAVAYLAKSLRGYTERVYISWLDFYTKVNRRLKLITEKQEIEFTDLTQPEYHEQLFEFAAKIQRIFTDRGIQVFTCAEAIDFKSVGIEPGSCIDGNLIKDLFNIKKSLKKDTCQRKECRCVKAVDVGIYNTCNFKCAYCYANSNEQIIERNLQRYNQTGPLLIGDYDGKVEIIREKQLTLFDCSHLFQF